MDTNFVVTGLETLEELVKKLYTYDMKSLGYSQLRQEIIKKLKENTKYDEIIAVIPSELTGDDMSIFPPNETVINTGYYNHLLADDVKFISDSSPYRFYERNEMEYNPQYRQLVTAALIRDKKHVILLQNGNGSNVRLKNKITMIQGHVAFSQEMYLRSIKDCVILNMEKEINEELRVHGSENCTPFEYLTSVSENIQPDYLLKMNSNFIDIEHLGAIFVIDVNNAEEVFSRLTTGEPENHDLILIPINEYHKYVENMDGWVQEILETDLKR